MRPLNLLVATSLCLLIACSGADLEPAETPAPTPAPTPEPVAEIELAPSVDESEITEATPGAFAMLTQGGGAKEAATPRPAAVAAKTDPGLGAPGGRTLAGKQVQAGIRPNLPQVRACYEKELKKGGEFSGRVVVAWTIGADGRVRSPRVIKNSTGNRAMLPCITRVVSRWRFDKAESPTDIEYPFRFKPSAGF